MTTARRDELSLICHPEGTIARVLSSDPGMSVAVGGSLTHLLLPESWVRCQRFLHMAARHGAAIGCELTVLGSKGPRALRFVAIRLSPDSLLIAASQTGDAILALLGAYFNPHQKRSMRARVDGPQCALDELARLNNELVNTQRELAKHQAVTHAQSRQRGELLATVAHDLRTPMTVVLGYCELLSKVGGAQAGQMANMVQRVCAAVQYALSILSQTLEYAKVESGALTLRLEQTDLRALASEVIELHRALATEKHIRIALHAGRESIPLVRVDRLLIQQTIGNLLTNAIKYSPSGTEVEVRVRPGDGHVRLSVQDHGLGIDPSFLPVLFRPFQTTSTQATAGEKSTGLGLAIVQKLVEAHGGTVEVQSALRQGSTFVVKLPVKPRDAAPGVTVLHDHDRSHNGRRRNGAERTP